MASSEGADPSDSERALAACAALIERYFDVIEANRIALDRLEVPANRQLALDLRADYERSARLLSELLFEAGREPPTHGDIRRVMTEAKVAIGELAGDRGVLGALKSNENGLLLALERVAKTPGLSSTIEGRLEEELALSRRHLAEVDERLEELRDSAHVLS
jgi:hypothetical protein